MHFGCLIGGVANRRHIFETDFYTFLSVLSVFLSIPPNPPPTLLFLNPLALFGDREQERQRLLGR